MTKRSSAKRTGSCLLAVLLSCLLSENVFVVGEPIPIPSELLYSESLLNNAENLILLSKLKEVIEEKKDTVEQERALNDEQMMIQSVLDARAKAKARIPVNDSGEELPTPNAIIGSPQRPVTLKRTAISYMTLCHFKICNMGRKRQLREEIHK